MTSALLLFVDLVAAVIWVGGMFFAHMALRPSLGLLDPPARLALMAATLGRFFAWVVAAVLAILVSGGALMRLSAAAGGAGSVRLMALVGVVMALVFAYIRLRPYPRLAAAVADRRWPDAGGGARRHPTPGCTQPGAWVGHVRCRRRRADARLTGFADRPRLPVDAALPSTRTSQCAYSDSPAGPAAARRH